MKLTLSWLKDFLETNASLEEISSCLTSIGLEVEEIIDPLSLVSHLIVGEVIECEKHPNADKLSLLKVNTGKEVVQVVCGAPNVRKGLKSVLALPNDFIPLFGEKLKKGVVRGVESCGMLCAEDELGLGSNHDGIIELDETACVGASIATVFDSDVVIEVSVTPNRGDCMSVYGIARDLAAAGLGSLKALPTPTFKETFKSEIVLTNEVVECGCPIFTLREIKNVKNVPSPLWMQNRLKAIGLRPISALVDVTNYFNITYGRPLHVFDANKVKGALKVRSAKEGETLLALDGKTYSLCESMVVIADENGVESIGGVMGGEVSGCTEETTSVLLESAYFTPETVAITGQKLCLTSDSRQRFERGIDTKATIEKYGSNLATQMILELCGGEASELLITGKEPENPKPIMFDYKRVEKLCGVQVEAKICKEILEKLGCEVCEKDDLFEVIPPSWRSDITGAHDLVEEVLRLYGYDKIPTIALSSANGVFGILQPRQKRELSVRRALAAQGAYQTITWSFLSSDYAKFFRTKDAVLIANPISADLNEMRPSLVPNLLSAARSNIVKGMQNGCLFEVGPEFFGYKPMEQQGVACVVRFGQTGVRHFLETPRAFDVFDAKKDALVALDAAGAPQSLQVVKEAPSWYHPGRSGAIKMGKTVLAYFGEIHPSVLKAMNIKTTMCACEVFLDKLPLPKQKEGKAVKALKMATLTPISRDLAFVVQKNIEAEKIVITAKNTDKNLIKEAFVFDVYEDESLGDKKSVAIQLTIQPLEKAMTDDEIESVCRRVVSAVVASTGGELRG